MFPSEIPRSFKYPFSEYENESTDLSYGSLSKPKDSPFYSNKDSNFYTAMNPKDSCFYSKDSTCYSKDYTREPVFYPRDSRRRTFIDEEYDPGVYKKICAEGCFDESRAKTTSFIDRKQENLSDKSWIHSSNTINFSNINSMTHFQRRPPMFNITMFEHKEEADKMIIPKENISFSGKNTNGLKSLSVRVREFVVKHKETSYKEIAEQLLKEIKRENRHSIEGAKEEQNIKRRIYDALNVLVATEIFKKKGKTVFYDGKSDVMGHDLMNKRVLGDKGELLKKNVKS